VVGVQTNRECGLNCLNLTGQRDAVQFSWPYMIDMHARSTILFLKLRSTILGYTQYV
jgi:hypothetical protein